VKANKHTQPNAHEIVVIY